MFEKPLFADYVPLSPAKKMGRNERCWCRSGKKWKNCHMDREVTKRLPNGAMLSQFDQQMKLETCMYPEAPVGCSEGSIRSHTVQRATALRLISENGHVLSGRDTKETFLPVADLERIGVNKASTFRGFCAYHGESIFRDADRASEISGWVAFLLGYRALAYELYMKIVSIPTLEYYRDNLDAGYDFEKQSECQQYINGQLYTSRVSIDEHSRQKQIWDSVLISKDLSPLSWASLILDDVLPVVTSGTFYPEFGFDGKRLQILNAAIGTLSLLSFNIVPIGGVTHAIFAGLEPSRKSKDFINSLLSLNSDTISSAILQFCFDTSDNIFVSPKWWKDLNPDYRSILTVLLRNSTPGQKDPNGLQPISSSLSCARLTESRVSWT